MTEMERRVALALRKWIDDRGRYAGGTMDGDGIAAVQVNGPLALVEMAQYAIRAMREPTPEMISAGQNSEIGHSWSNRGEHTYTPESVWEDMIDAASPPCP